MIIAVVGGVLLLGILCAVSPRTRFLSSYLLLVPVFAFAGALLSFVVSGATASGLDHRAQARMVQGTFFAGTILGAASGLVLARWVNRRLKL